VVSGQLPSRSHASGRAEKAYDKREKNEKSKKNHEKR
jgi:hypothetical protein